MTIQGAAVAHSELVGGGQTTLHSHAGGAGEAENIVRTTSDVSNSTTTLADITGLSFAIGANEDYVFEAWLIFQSDTTSAGIGFACNGPTSPVAVVMLGFIPTSVSASGVNSTASRAYETCVPSTGVDVINANLVAKIDGIVRNGANAGTFTLRFKSEVATKVVKVMTGSVLRYRKTN